jgi:hypothetical protein
MRIAAIADLHCRTSTGQLVRELLEGVSEEGDVLVLAGDLTDTGLPAELDVLLGELGRLRIPMVAVLGNHDHENDQAERLVGMLEEAGIRVLEGTVCEIDGVGFVGTKGFCGGFDERMVQPFGERTLKTFIQASIEEAVGLENALARLDSGRRVAVLHYAPVPATLVGESLELYPFLGSSRLANALDRRGVDLIVHGHAHHGSPEGHTPGGIPVHNVSRFVTAGAARRAYRVFDV